MSNIIFADESKFIRLKENFKKSWLENLHILSDFDWTLTKSFDNWKKIPWIFQIIKEHNLLWDEFTKKWKELFDKYYPIEIDHNITNYDKKAIMLEWWEKTFELLIEYWYNMKIVDYIWSNIFIKLRDWYKEFFDFINKKNIPIIIMSAAWTWTESIEKYLNNNIENTKNIKILSNNFTWNDKWTMVWYKKPIIHAFNKDETIINDYPEIYDTVKNKKNVILLWDSLGDHHMIDWFEYENLLKIWFLHKNDKLQLDEYIKRYDIIILWEGDMSFINNFLKECF